MPKMRKLTLLDEPPGPPRRAGLTPPLLVILSILAALSTATAARAGSLISGPSGGAAETSLQVSWPAPGDPSARLLTAGSERSPAEPRESGLLDAARAAAGPQAYAGVTASVLPADAEFDAARATLVPLPPALGAGLAVLGTMVVARRRRHLRLRARSADGPRVVA